MPERKRRDDLENFNTIDLDNDLLKDEPIELGAGCSISLDYDEGAPTVYVKTYGEVDTTALRRKLEQNYPGAKIEGLNPNVQVHPHIKKKRKTSNKKTHK
jgi:hypothetical protein